MTREEAIWRILDHERIHSKKEPFTPYLDKAFTMAIEALKAQRPHGQWRLNEDGNYECSECGIAWKDMPVKDAKPVFKACPWCGIEIRDGEAK